LHTCNVLRFAADMRIAAKRPWIDGSARDGSVRASVPAAERVRVGPGYWPWRDPPQSLNHSLSLHLVNRYRAELRLQSEQVR
jgi:hypothetical protein